MVSGGQAAMPAYLFIAMIANLAFIVRACKDACGKKRPIARGPAVAILTCAISELCWVVPCFVQCFVIFVTSATSTSSWSAQSRVGCDVMGFYSQFGSLCSMLATLLVGVITYRSAHFKVLPSARTTVAASIGIFLFALVISLLPLVGATEPYAYSGEGFCYIDWFDPPQAVIMLLVSLPTMLAVVALYGGAARGEWEKKTDLLLLIVGCLSAWVLWPPAAFIGLSGGSFPSGYMISGGVLGHAQALINPYLYGVRWRAAMARRGGLASKPVEPVNVEPTPPTVSA